MRIVKNITWQELQSILSHGEEFKNTTGNFRGEVWTSDLPPYPGRMDVIHYDHLRYELAEYGIDYVVFSYNTPIAWRNGLGKWFSPDAGYSKTTTRHSSQLRTAIGELNKLAA